MTLRPPRGSPDRAKANGSHIEPLDYEIARERAAALGRQGRALEAALAALSDYDSARWPEAEKSAAPASLAASRGEQRRRDCLVQEASEALWCFVVQREACGLRDPRPVLRDYRVPAEVYARMGAFRRR